MFVEGRPRYWIGWYDRWHLPLAAGFLALAGWLAWQPRPVVKPVPVVATPVPTPAALYPTVLDSPAAGGRWKPSQRLEVAGRAHPGSRVVLFHAGTGRAESALAQVVADAQGRFRFALAGLGPGEHTVWAVAYAADGRWSRSLPVPFTVVAEAARSPRPARRR